MTAPTAPSSHLTLGEGAHLHALDCPASCTPGPRTCFAANPIVGPVAGGTNPSATFQAPRGANG